MKVNITLIGIENVDGTLAVVFRKTGDSEIFGVKDPCV